MNNKIDDIELLYKYRPIDSSGHTEGIFTNNTLWFSSPLDFNDPFDCRPKFDYSATEEQMKKYFMEIVPKSEPHLTTRQLKRARVREIMKEENFKNPEILKTIEKNVEDDTNKVGVCCFSAKRDNLLMWSHYADSHRGICLEFEATSNTPDFGSALKIHYQDEYPVTKPFVDSKDKQAKAALLTKAKDWEYEKEWRIISVKEGAGLHRFIPEHLKGVILGAKISEENTKNVISWAQKRDLPLQIYQAQLKEIEYGLDINPFMTIEAKEA